MKKQPFVLWFKDLRIKDVPLVGGKNASLGEMYSQLTKKGVNVPNGFAVTAQAYHYFLEQAGIKKQIKIILRGLDINNIDNLYYRGHKVRELILKSSLPKELEREIVKAYKKLSALHKDSRRGTDVAVRSSATAEDLPDASFAGQQDTFLNIRGEKELLKSCKACFASLFTNRAIVYRETKKFDHFKIGLSIGVQKMVRSDLSSSGVMFSIDTESGFKDTVLINSIYGLGENIVQGKVTPDEFYVFKPTLKKKIPAILSRKIGSKAIKMVYTHNSKKPVKDIKVPERDREKLSVSDLEVLTLANWAMTIEKHYNKPMDMEWAKDGRDNKLYIVQARPETVHSQKNPNILEEYKLLEHKKPIVIGASVGSKIGAGKINVIKDLKDIKKFQKGQILVTDMTDPDWVPIMKIAGAIVTDKGGRTCFSGDTKILTNKGFFNIKDIKKKQIKDGLSTPSLNRDTLKVEWKKITDTMARSSKTVKINFSQTGRHKDNFLNTTPDHKFITLNNRTLINKEINKIIKEKNTVLAADKITSYSNKKISRELAYLWGCIYTDGSIYLSKTHGEVQFIQKQVPEKELLINTVNKYFLKLFNKKLGISEKKLTNTMIRGKKVKGSATAFRCYSKEVAIKFKNWKENLVLNLLNCQNNINYYFLAGVIDGDGTYNQKANRINIFCSNENLLQAIVISCLKLNIFPQVTNNRHIYNIQIVDKVGELLKYTKRVKGQFNRASNGTKLLSAKQLFYDIADMVNFKGKIKPYINKNLLIDKEKIKNNILPLLKGNIKNILENILKANFVSTRAVQEGKEKNEKVYNITIEDNHNYLAFTSKYTPIIVNNCHAAIVSRELGVPCIVGSGDATRKLKHGKPATVSCAEGEKGYVYEGLLRHKIVRHNLKNLKRPKTKIMMNIGSPENAFAESFIPNDGVGLAREEFIINSYIKIHPLALIHFEKLKKSKRLSKETIKKIEEITKGYKDKKQFFIDKLAEGVAIITAAFYPKDVIVRLSDFKSNEYANLIGGHLFEPTEDNPMIGWRGASRYYSKEYRPAFEMECRAIQKVRQQLGLKNLKIMIPFCRTIDEGQKVIQIMKKNGLQRGKDGLEIYVMTEIPSNVILLEEFAKIFDGFSIGSNDLTQLTLGVDRDSTLVSHVYDERNLAVKTLVLLAIEKAKKKHKKIGICGQAPSDFPDFATFLVECGIDSISLNPDTVIKTTMEILKKEKKIKK